MPRKLFQTQIPNPQELLQQFQGFNQPEKRTEAIVGFRVWYVVKDGGLPKLMSVSHTQFTWPYRKALERDAICNAGIHAIKNANYPGGLIGLFRSYGAHVAGEVYLWGQVTECSGGYLAQYAYPKRLFCPPEMDPTTVMQLEDEYGVPCEFRNEFEKQKQPDPPTIQPPPPLPVSIHRPIYWFNPYAQYWTYTTTSSLPSTGGLAGVVQGVAQQLGYAAGLSADQNVQAYIAGTTIKKP